MSDARCEATLASGSKKLSTLDSTFIVFGAIVGVGIFATPGVAVGLIASGSSGGYASLILWVAGGAMAIVQSLCYAELGASIVGAGGQYDYLRLAFGDAMGFMFNVQNFFVNLASVAGVALIFAQYFLGALQFSGGFLRASGVETKVAAVLCTWLLAFLNTRGIEIGTCISNVIGCMKVLLCLVIVFTGVVWGSATSSSNSYSSSGSSSNSSSFANSTGSALATDEWDIQFPNLGSAFVAVYYSYGGGQTIGNFAEEMDRPGVTIPCAIVGGTLIVIVLYVLVNAAYLLVFPVRAIATSDSLAIEFMQATAGEGFGAGTGMAIALSAACTLSIYLMQVIGRMNARMTFAVARDGLFPAPLARTNASSSPAMAMLANTAWVTVCIVTGSFEQLLFFSAFGFWFYTALTAFAVVRVRARYPRMKRPFRVPCYPAMPLLLAAFSCACLVGSFVSQPLACTMSLAFVTGSYPLYLLHLLHARQSGSSFGRRHGAAIAGCGLGHGHGHVQLPPPPTMAVARAHGSHAVAGSSSSSSSSDEGEGAFAEGGLLVARVAGAARSAARTPSKINTRPDVASV